MTSKATNRLLSIIAINLTIITGLLALQAIPTATAQSGIQKIALCSPYTDQCAGINLARLLIDN